MTTTKATKAPAQAAAPAQAEAQAPNFKALTGKSGKISKGAEREAHALNLASNEGLKSIAVFGRGGMAKRAALHVIGKADSITDILKKDALQGHDWANLLSLLVATYGTKQFIPTKMSGRVGCSLYVQAVTAFYMAECCIAETEKKEAAAMKKIEELESIAGNIEALMVVHETAKAAAMAKQ